MESAAGTECSILAQNCCRSHGRRSVAMPPNAAHQELRNDLLIWQDVIGAIHSAVLFLLLVVQAGVLKRCRHLHRERGPSMRWHLGSGFVFSKAGASTTPRPRRTPRLATRWPLMAIWPAASARTKNARMYSWGASDHNGHSDEVGLRVSGAAACAPALRQASADGRGDGSRAQGCRPPPEPLLRQLAATEGPGNFAHAASKELTSHG